MHALGDPPFIIMESGPNSVLVQHLHSVSRPCFCPRHQHRRYAPLEFSGQSDKYGSGRYNHDGGRSITQRGAEWSPGIQRPDLIFAEPRFVHLSSSIQCFARSAYISSTIRFSTYRIHRNDSLDRLHKCERNNVKLALYTFQDRFQSPFSTLP